MNEDCFVVALVSGKGGTGKTTLTANFAVELASAARTAANGSGEKNRVLVIDNDYATGGTSYLLAGGERLKTGVESQMIQPRTCFYDCYAQRIPPEQVTPLRLLFEDKSVGEFEVHVLLNSLTWWRTPLPGAVDEDEEPVFFQDASAQGFLDRELLPYYETLIRHFRQFYDYIIIDSRGGADTRASVAAVVADSVVIVTEPGEVAGKQDVSFVQSLRSLAEQIDRRIGGVSVIYNRVLSNEKRVRDRHSDLTVIGRLPISQNVVQCYRNTELIFERRPLDAFCIEAIKAFEARFPGVRGICQIRRRWARTYLRLKNFCADSSIVFKRATVAAALILGVGVAALAGGAILRTEAALLWIGFLTPVLTGCAGAVLAFSAWRNGFDTDQRPQQLLWGAAGGVVLLAAIAVSLVMAKGVDRIREGLPPGPPKIMAESPGAAAPQTASPR